MFSDSADVAQAVAALQAREATLAWLRPNGEALPEPRGVPAGILSGSFNPLHDGHRALRETAESILGGSVCFEMTITNADKPPLDAITVTKRLRQFRLEEELVAVTAAATFVEKARLFAGTTFVVGVDTADRILQPRFYDGDTESMRAALSGIQEAACRFLVAGRSLRDSFATLRQLTIPREFSELFVELPEQQFRADVSSTGLRAEGT